ncbi:MAG: DUF1285 domain-containing protein [Caulobacterales bacterium]|nr:DUF1285 domain-containing protein [Caulobacterales bacterium]
MSTIGVIPAGLIGIADAARRGLPPVHLWDPPHCGEIDILIRADGVWMHEGSPIGRKALVRLFSTVLRKDPDGYCLVTPVEKLSIQVEDVPFRAVAVDHRGDELVFMTDVGDETAAGRDHPIRVVTAEDGEPRPYVHVRGALEARIERAVFYELVEAATRNDEGVLGLWSGGIWFELGRDR